MSDNRKSTLVLILLLALAWSLPIARVMVERGDFPAHLQVAQAMAERPHLPVAHFLFFALAAAMMRLMPMLSPQAVGVAVVTFLQLSTAALIWAYIRRTSKRPPAWDVVLTLSLLIAGPILPPFIKPDQYMIGYFLPNPHHNATFITARPFALLVLVSAAAALDGARPRGAIIGAAAVVLLSAIAKPNYLLCLIPALLLLAAWRIWKRQRIDWRVTAVMAALSLLMFVAMARAYGDQGIAVIVAPFAVMSLHTTVGPSLALKLVASLAFPIVVTMMFPSLRKSTELSLAWLATLIGLVQGYLLAEDGTRMDHASLLAGSSMATFVLFVVSAKSMQSLPESHDTQARVLRWIALAILLLHVVGGYHFVREFVTAAAWMTPLSAVALLAMIVWTTMRVES